MGGEVPWERRAGKASKTGREGEVGREGARENCMRDKQSEGCSDPDLDQHFSHVKNAGLGEVEGGCGGAWPENCC